MCVIVAFATARICHVNQCREYTAPDLDCCGLITAIDCGDGYHLDVSQDGPFSCMWGTGMNHTGTCCVEDDVDEHVLIVVGILFWVCVIGGIVGGICCCKQNKTCCFQEQGPPPAHNQMMVAQTVAVPVPATAVIVTPEMTPVVAVATVSR